MKSGQPILIFLALAVLLFGAALVYKAVHHRHGSAPAAALLSPPAAPVPVSAPVRPQETPAVPAQRDLVKAGVQNPVFAVREQLDTLGPALQAAMNGQRLTLADLDKLEFGGPGTGSNPAYNIFNPQGKIAFVPRGGKWIGQDVLDDVTGKRGAQLVYNMRRLTDEHGMPTEILYAIIPGISPKNCGASVGVAEYKVSEALSIEPDTREIIDDPEDMPVIKAGCLQAPGQPLVWFYAIKLRTKLKGTDHWTSHAP